MAADWPTLSLREAGVLLIDCEHKTPPASDSGYPYIAIPQIKHGRIDLTDVRRISREYLIAWTRKANPKPHDVILSRRCNPGETAFVPPGLECALGQNLVLLRADGTKVSPPFLRWLVSGPDWWEQIGKFINVGAVFDSLKCADIPNFELPIPPLSEQRAIAHILGTLDDKIELNRKMNQTLEAMARAIFKSWFVDFDPVRAKAEGRDPGLPRDLAALFPDSFEDSELGEIPKGWRVMPVGEALKAVGGSTPRTGNPVFWEAGEFHWATPKDLSGLPSPILIETERKITKAGIGEISSGLLPVGTVLMSSRAPVGYLALSGMPVAVNQGFIAMICDGPVSNYYALNWCYYNMEEIQQRASGTTFAEISKAAFRPILMIVPKYTIMKRFTEIVAPLYKSIGERLKETRALAALRDVLLPKLLSGEVRVKDSKKIEEATAIKDEINIETVRKPGKRKATDEFREAILISALVRALSNDDYPLGRKRYSKICYLIHRKLQHAVEQKYLKKAAGPYSPWTRYKGPERIAIQNSYIKETQKGVLTGFGVGPQISNIDQYLSRYDFNAVLGWAVNNFGKLTNERLELLTTVDFASLELRSKGQQVNSKTVRALIEAEPVWAPKLNRAIFSEINIQSALRAIYGYFTG